MEISLKFNWGLTSKISVSLVIFCPLDTKLYLKKSKQNTRICRIYSSSYLEEKQVIIAIGNNGIKDNIKIIKIEK